MKKQLAYVLYSNSTDRYHSSESFNGTIVITETLFYDTETHARNGLRGVKSYFKGIMKKNTNINPILDFEVTPLEIKHI